MLTLVETGNSAFEYVAKHAGRLKVNPKPRHRIFKCIKRRTDLFKHLNDLCSRCYQKYSQLKSSLQDLGLPKQDVRRGLLQLASKPQVVLKRISTPKHGLINLKKEEKNSRVPPTDWRDDSLALGATHSKLEESKKDTETNNSKENCDTNRSSLENYSKENKRKSMSPKSSTKHSAKKTPELLSRVTHDASKVQSHLHPFDKDLAKLDRVVLNRYKKDENTKEKPCRRKMTPSVLKSILPPEKVPATLNEVSKLEKKLSTSDRKCDIRKNIKRRECLQTETNSDSNTRKKDSENAVSELLLDNVGPEMYEAHIHGKHNHIKINLSLGPPLKSCDSSKSDHYSGRNMKETPYYKPTDSTNIPDTTTDERSTMDVMTGANKIQIATDQISLDITTMPVSFSDCRKDNEKMVGISKSHKDKNVQRKRSHKVIPADSSVKKQRTSSSTTDVSSDVNNWKKKKKIWRKLRECFGELISVSEEEEEEKLWPRKRRRKHSTMSNDSGVSALGRNVAPTTPVEVLKKFESLHEHTLAKDINSGNSFDTIMYSKERLDSKAEEDRSIKRIETNVRATELPEIRSDTSELLKNSERGELKNNDAEVEIRESQIVNSNSIVEECATSKVQDVVSSEATVKAETEIKNTTTDLLKQIETQSNDEHVVSSSQDNEILELTEVSNKPESLESKEDLIELLHSDLTKTCQIVSEGNVLSLSEKETIGRNEEHLKEDKTIHNTEETLRHDVCNHVQKNNVEVTTPVTKQKADTTLRDMPSLAEEFFANVPLSEDCNSVAVETPTVADTQITVNPSPVCTYGKLRVRTSAELGSRWCPTPAQTPSYPELPIEILPSSTSSSTESLNQNSTMIHSSMPKSKSIQNPLDTASGGNVTKGTNVQNVTNLRNYKSNTSSGGTVSQQVINLNPQENGQEGLPRENGLQGQKTQENIPSNFIIHHEPSNSSKNPYRITVSIPLVTEVSYHAEKNKNGISKSAAGPSDCYPSSSQGTKTVRQDSIQTASSTVQQSSSSITNGPPKNYLSQTAADYLPRTITDYTPYQLNNNNLNNNNLNNNNLNHNNLNNNNLNHNNLNHNNLNNNNLNHNNLNKTQIRHTMPGQQSGKTLVQVPTMQTARPVPNDLYKYILCQQTQQNAHLAASLTNNPNRPEMQNIYTQEFRHWTQPGISQVMVPPNNRIQQESLINYAGGILIIPSQPVQVTSSSASSVGTTNRTVMRQNVNLRNPNHSQTLISNQMTMNPVQYLSTIPSNNVNSNNVQVTQQVPNNACGNQTMLNINQWGTRFQQNLTSQQVPVRNQQVLMAEQQTLMRNQQVPFMKPQPAMLQPVVQQPNYVNLNQTISQPNLVKPAEQANVQSFQGIAPVSQSQDQRVPYTTVYNTEKAPVLRTGFDGMPSNIVNQNLIPQNNQHLNRFPPNIGNCISEKGYTPECLQQQKSSSETNAGNESSLIPPSGKEKTKFEVLNDLSFKQRLELVRQIDCSLIHFLSLYKYMTVEQSSEIFSSTSSLIEMKNVIEKNLKDLMQDCYRELPGDQNLFDTTMKNVENKGNSCTENNTSSVQKSSDTQLNDETQGSFDKVSGAEHEERNKDKESLNIAVNDQEKFGEQKKAETGDPLPDATTSGDNTEVIGKEIVSSVEKSMVPEKNKNSLEDSNYNCTQQSQEEINTLRALYHEQIDDSLSPLGSPLVETTETSPSTTETEETLGDLRDPNTSNSTCTIVINQKEDTVVDTSLSTDINSPKSEECEKNDYSLTEEALSETTNDSSIKEESSDVEDTQFEDTSNSTNDNTIILNVTEDSKDLKPNIRDVSIEGSDSSEKTIIKISSDLNEEPSDTDKKVVVSETNAYIYGESSKETYFKEIDNTKTDMCNVISDEESSSNETLIFDSVDENSSNTVIPSSVSHTDSNVDLCEITENKSDIDLHLENSDYLSSPDILIADVRSIPVHRFHSMDEKEISDFEEENEIVIEEIKSEVIDSESDQDVQEKINEHCLNCEKPSSVVCERCLQAHYCSKRCSDLKWKSHYQECQPYNAHTKHF